MALVLVNSLGAPFVAINKLSMILPQKMQDAGMKVVDMCDIAHGVQSEFVGLSNGPATLYSAPGKPHGKPGWIVVPTIPFFRHRGTAELPPPYDKGLVQ